MCWGKGDGKGYGSEQEVDKEAGGLEGVMIKRVFPIPTGMEVFLQGKWKEIAFWVVSTRI